MRGRIRSSAARRRACSRRTGSRSSAVRALDRAGSPLPGARVTILEQAAYGYTLSRADGVYDLAVNGAAVVVQVDRDGYLPVQRRIETQWHDFGWADDAAATPLDPVAT